MRRSITIVSLAAAFLAAACTDTPPTGLRGGPKVTDPLMNVAPTQSLSDFIDQEIAAIYDRGNVKGNANSVAARWASVKRRKAAGDTDGAKKQFIQLADWIEKKLKASTLPPVPPEEKARVTRLVYAMSLWVFVGEATPVPQTGTDSKFAVVPAGAAADVVTDAEQAGISIAVSSTDEDRVIAIVEDATKYSGLCNGPLDTPLCQYPLFYTFKSFPDKRLKKVARFAVCLVTAGDRATLDYLDGDPREPKIEVHGRVALAHEKPADPADFTPGSTVVGNIEILPRSTSQKGFTKCSENPIEYALSRMPVRGGWLGRGQRALLAVARFAGNLVTPKNLYAYDSGPEHYGLAFSHFNAVDPQSQPDLKVAGLSAAPDVFRGDETTVAYTVTNKSRRQLDGNATAAADATSASVYLVRENFGEGDESPTIEEVQLCNSEETCAVGIHMLRPDAEAVTIAAPLVIPETVDPGQWFVEVRVEPNVRLAEIDLDNNVARSATPILIKKKLPDLVFGSGFTVTSPTTVKPGGWITTSTWAVKNAGNAASGPFIARFYLVSASGAARELGSPIDHESLSPGSSVVHAGVELAVPTDVAPAAYDVVLRLDPANAVEEFHDDNNGSAPQPLVVEQADVPLVLNLTAVEKLPNGTQRFTLQDGGPGPYLWSVNGIDGGNATFGTIVVAGDNSADYTAPAAVPDPATFDVCARRQANVANQACAAVTIKPIPSSGTDVVVFNDINFFDNFAAQNANNVRLFTNLVDYTAPGARSGEKGVMLHFGHSSLCCGPSYIQTLINTYNNRGNPVTVVNDALATITSVPAGIKLLYLILPGTPYSTAEINVLKQFASEGGRIVFIGEHGSFYPTQITTVQNPFFQKMGAQLTNTGALIDCGYNTLPQSSIRSHQITEGLTNVTMACASKITLGRNDYALVYGSDGVSLIAAVARIDVTPLPLQSLAAKSLTPLMSSAPAANDDEDPVGAKHAQPPSP